MLLSEQQIYSTDRKIQQNCEKNEVNVEKTERMFERNKYNWLIIYEKIILY